MSLIKITTLRSYVAVAVLWVSGADLHGQRPLEQEDYPRWEVQLSPQERLIAQGGKGDEVFSIKNLKTGRSQAAAELNKWYIHWNHDHLIFSPDGRWALWRDSEDGLVVASLHGQMKRRAWNDLGDEHDPLAWQPDNWHFFELQDSTNSHGRNPRDRIEIFDRAKLRKRVSRMLSVQEEKQLEEQSN